MKISKLFHWLYFMVMMLPLFAIPVYAIYVRNENSTYTETVQVEENKVVDFNQYIYNGDFASGESWVSLNGTVSYSDNICTYNVTSGIGWFDNSIRQESHLETVGHTLYLSCYININGNYKCGISLNGATIYQDLSADVDTHIIGTALSTSVYYAQIGIESPVPNNTVVFKAHDFFVVDLTQMFGAGNEPTAQQFNTFYPDQYYEYTTGEKQLLKNYQTVTYSDSDVGSQLVYTTYNTVNKYFNYDSVFNFGDLYDWLQLTFFNGNATLGFFIFWHCLIYWLLTSLLWLIFDVLMYVPMLAHRWLDKASLS